MKIMLVKNSVLKTGLSQEANIQYTRLLRHIEWLDKKHLIELIIEDGKVHVKLTMQGRQFAMLILQL